MIRRILALTLLPLLALVLPSAAAEAATLEEVLEQYYEAIGGVEAWDSWETVQFTGEMSMGGGQMVAPFTMTFANGTPGKSRLEFTVQGMTGIMAYDGETAWSISPFMGTTDPEPMSEEQARTWEEQSDFAGPLVHPDKKGVELEYLGEEDVQGTPAHKIKVTLSSGDVRFYYLDSEYFLPIRTEAKTTMQGQEIEVETSLGDYKEVGGLMFAHNFESRPKGAPEGSGQTISIQEASFGVELPADYFTMPAPAPAASEDG